MVSWKDKKITAINADALSFFLRAVGGSKCPSVVMFRR